MKRQSYQYRRLQKENSYRFRQEIEQLDLPYWKKTIAYESTPYTVTHLDTILDLIETTEKIVHNHVTGDIVECGVHCGGSCMIIANVLQHYQDERTIWMYDTYDGIPIPDEVDVALDGRPLRDLFFEQNRLDEDGNSSWCYTNLDHVKENMSTCNYSGTINYIQGLVEDTIPNRIPEQIALLRIDVDLAEPTKHSLEHLYPLLSKQGALILDDYGHFPSVKKVVDDYLGDISKQLNEVTYTVRTLVK